MDLSTKEQKTSYALGLNMGMQISNMPLDFDLDAFVCGMKDMFENTQPKISQQEFNTLLNDLFGKMESEHHCNGDCNGECHGDCHHADSGETKKKGDEYRAENAKKAGVRQTASGLQIEVIREGNGKSPKATDTVKVHYTGKLIDGTVFDSSVERGEPIEFPLNRVIAGWTEGLQLMKIGEKSILTIPPEIGYGEQGAGHVIPPNATLVFEVELLDIK